MSRFTGNTRSSAALAAICIAQFVIVLDVTVVTPARPAIRDDVGFTARGLPWVITAYTLVLGGCLVAGGRIADVVGARKVFLIGLAVFGVASATCAVAWSPAALLTGRAAQGIGASLLAPAGLALLTATTEPGPVRRRAVGIWGASAASGGASGWVLGGVLTEFLSWRAVFAIVVPIGIVALAISIRVLPRTITKTGRADLPGAVLATAALGSAAYALTLKNPYAGVLAVGLTAALVWHLRRTEEPLIPPRLLRNRTIAGANLTALALTATTSSGMYVAVLVVQEHLSPAKASLLFPVFNATVIAGSLAGPALLRRAGARNTLFAGFVLIAAGGAVFTITPTDDLAIGPLLGAFAAMGAGLGAASMASTHSGSEAAEPAYQGVSAGVLNSSAQVGTSFGLALVAPAADHRTGFVIATALTLIGFAGAALVPRAGAREQAVVKV